MGVDVRTPWARHHAFVAFLAADEAVGFRWLGVAATWNDLEMDGARYGLRLRDNRSHRVGYYLITSWVVRG